MCDKYLHPIYIIIKLIAGVNRCTHGESIALNFNILLLQDLYHFIVLCLMYRVYINSSAYSVQHLYTIVSTVHNRVTRSSKFCFYVPQCNTNARHKFIIYQ